MDFKDKMLTWPWICGPKGSKLDKDGQVVAHASNLTTEGYLSLVEDSRSCLELVAGRNFIV
jgi:hypothetical protein